MFDLNDLRTFERVASLRSFSSAARILEVPKSSVSRSISRLEVELGVRLLQRSTRTVQTTAAGDAFLERCQKIMREVGDALDYASIFTGTPRGTLRLSAGLALGNDILVEQLPIFLDECPELKVLIELSSREADLLSDRIDVAIRTGPLRDSDLVVTRLGGMSRYLCAAPAYILRHGTPHNPQDLYGHHIIETPGRIGPRRPWSFQRAGEEVILDLEPRITVNDTAALFKLVRNGCGIGVLSSYACGPVLAAGELLHLLPDWMIPPVEVSLIFPSARELAPAVRAFIKFMKRIAVVGELWQADAYKTHCYAADRTSDECHIASQL